MDRLLGPLPEWLSSFEPEKFLPWTTGAREEILQGDHAHGHYAQGKESVAGRPGCRESCSDRRNRPISCRIVVEKVRSERYKMYKLGLTI